jgi:hypothetical protein
MRDRDVPNLDVEPDPNQRLHEQANAILLWQWSDSEGLNVGRSFIERVSCDSNQQRRVRSSRRSQAVHAKITNYP